MNTKTTVEQVETNRIFGQRYFVICGSCYWCASVLHPSAIGACQSCQNKDVDAIPISSDEAYVLDYNRERGITLDFVPMRIK
jgi:hypothetical protein